MSVAFEGEYVRVGEIRFEVTDETELYVSLLKNYTVMGLKWEYQRDERAEYLRAKLGGRVSGVGIQLLCAAICWTDKHLRRTARKALTRMTLIAAHLNHDHDLDDSWSLAGLYNQFGSLSVLDHGPIVFYLKFGLKFENKPDNPVRKLTWAPWSYEMEMSQKHIRKVQKRYNIERAEGSHDEYLFGTHPCRIVPAEQETFSSRTNLRKPFKRGDIWKKEKERVRLSRVKYNDHLWKEPSSDSDQTGSSSEAPSDSSNW